MKKTIVAIVLLGLVVSSGCLSEVGGSIEENTPDGETSTSVSPTETTPDSGDMEGYLVVEIVHEVPSDAPIVDASNETIQNVTLVQQAIENATTTGQNVTVRVTGEQVLRVEKALGKLPWYRGKEKPDGNYIREDDTVVVVYLKVLA